MNDSEEEIEDIQKEIAVLAQCRCPQVTKYHCCELVPESSKLYIIMEYMAGGSVADLVRGASPIPSSRVLMRLAYTHTPSGSLPA